MGTLSVFVIVFREILEIALTLVLIVLGTQLIPRRNRWLVLGLLLGVGGSLIVAKFIDQIAGSLMGVGQEVFQGGILALSAVLIVYTVVWMKRHAYEISQSVKSMSKQVVSGQRPLFALSTIIALTVLRDGSEVAVLAQGLSASGVSIMDLVIGSTMALLTGSLVAWAAYRGVLHLKVHNIFTTLSIVLIFLAAGMASQSAGFLSSAGILPELKSRLWDTSWLLEDRSFIGQILHILLGYSARPSALQVICYFATLLVASTLLYTAYRRPMAILATLALLGSALLCTPKAAQAIDLIYSPTVHRGELEIEERGTFCDDHRQAEDSHLKTTLSVGYGVNDWWATEVGAEVEHERGEQAELSAVKFENRFQLTEQGEYLWDLGVYGEYEQHTLGGSADGVEAKLLLENTWHALTTTINFIAEREVGKLASDDIEGGVAAEMRYRWRPDLQPGIELQSELGVLKDLAPFKEQEHLIGPAVAGRLGQAFKYELSLLFGVSDAAPDRVFRWMLEYEFNTTRR